MRVLIFGANGMLGHKLYQRLSERFDVFGTIRSEFVAVERFQIFSSESIIENVEVDDISRIERAIDIAMPDCVVNAIGVIKQAPEMADPLATLTVNSVFPVRLQMLAERHGFGLITISTDCIFAGRKGNYSEADIPDATDLYGVSKFLGEVGGENALTVRTSLIGRELGTSQSIVEWFIGNRGGRVKGFPRAIYSGFPTVVFADVIADLVENHRELNGVWNITSEPISKLDLLVLLNRYFDANVEITPDDSVVIDRSLDPTRFRNAIGFVPEPWDAMIARMAADPTPYDKWRT